MPDAGEVRRVLEFHDFFGTVEAEYPKFFEVDQHALHAMHSVADRRYENQNRTSVPFSISACWLVSLSSKSSL